MGISSEIVRYRTEQGVNVPAIVLTAYDVDGIETDDKVAAQTADIMVLGGSITKFSGVAKGAAPGQFDYVTSYEVA